MEDCKYNKCNEVDTASLKTEQKELKNNKISKAAHIKEETTENGVVRYHCTACDKKFGSRSQKYYHLDCTNSCLNFKCNMCNKSFSRTSQLKYHAESHASSVNKCSQCHKSFLNPLALKKHESLHKVEPKQCPHCDKIFRKLEQHIAAQHLGVLEHHCNFCNKKYASKSSLKLHQKSHEPKGFRCSFCGKLFQRTSTLKVHLKRHDNTIQLKCNVCHKEGFKDAGALIRHGKIHEVNCMYYRCVPCDDLYILRKDNMIRHIRTVHPDATFSDIVEKIMRSNETNAAEEKSDNEFDENKVLQTDNIMASSMVKKAGINIIENQLLILPRQNMMNFELENSAVQQVNVIQSCNASKDANKQETEKAIVSFAAPAPNQFEIGKFNNIEHLSNPHNSSCNIAALKINESHEIIYKRSNSVIQSVGNVSKEIPLKQLLDTKTDSNNITATTTTYIEYKHKKYNRQYDIDLYRKILGCDDNDDDEDEDDDNVEPNEHNSDTMKTNEVKIQISTVEENPVKLSSPLTTPVHWRKKWRKYENT